MSSSIIGGLNEKSLHRQLKERYSSVKSVTEQSVSGYVVDVVNPEELIEIQTGNFSGIRKKLKVLLQKHPVRLVYPLAAETIISVYNNDGSLRSRRRSPKRATTCTAASELLYIPDILDNINLTVEILLVKQEEIRCDNGKGSWRRGGISIEDRLLTEVIDCKQFYEKTDYLKLLPSGLSFPFGNREVAEKLPPLGTGRRGQMKLAGQITYLLRKLDLIENYGKDGNRLLFTITSD